MENKGTDIEKISVEETIVFAGGCFWATEKLFSNIAGVINVISGYAGGNYSNPKYEDLVLYAFQEPKTIKNHTECVRVIFDSSKINSLSLIKKFWESINPTEEKESGSNYRTVIFYCNKEQKKEAKSTKEIFQKALFQYGFGKIITTIEELAKFYPAEEYHQGYLKKNPNGYCPDHSTGVVFSKKLVNNCKLKPLGKKEIVVIKSESCSNFLDFEKNIAQRYKGTIPMRCGIFSNIEEFDNLTKVECSPTIFCIEDGAVVSKHMEVATNEKFYKILAGFKLGKDSKEYDVAFAGGTDIMFCEKYEYLRNVENGVFVDILSNEELFSTEDIFDSGSGWLSFYKAIDEDLIIEKKDNSYGMYRIEVLAKESGIHLGHVFDDAPNNKRRFCINASMLDFVPQNKDL
jgi:peptide methionine sulfoxide reductase msrA/msrB